jgi:hypothetical protein
VRRILVVAVLALLVGAGAYAETPEQSSMQQYDPPKTKDYFGVISEDGYVTILYDSKVHIEPPVERYAKLYAHVDQHFRGIGRDGAKLTVYLHSYTAFERRLNKHWPEGAEQMRQGWAVYYAFTYEAKQGDIVVIETYQHLTDNTMIHELLHHYMNRLAKDGSLNNEELVSEYSYHLEAVFRTTLEKEY